jgi:hypothetical protein
VKKSKGEKKAGGRSKERVNGKLVSTVGEFNNMEGEECWVARARSEDKRGVYKGMMCSGLGLRWKMRTSVSTRGEEANESVRAEN